MSLPSNTLFQEALSQNEELVGRLMDERKDEDDDDRSSSRIRMRDFSPEVEALYNITDRLGDVCSGLAGLGGSKPRRVSPMKRPQTAWERISQARQRDKHERLVRRVLPNGPQPLPGTG